MIQYSIFPADFVFDPNIFVSTLFSSTCNLYIMLTYLLQVQPSAKSDVKLQLKTKGVVTYWLVEPIAHLRVSGIRVWRIGGMIIGRWEPKHSKINLP
jgi:hypothetical protein